MRYNVKVKFGSDGKILVSEDEILVTIKAAPEKGKANQELTRVLSRFFEVDKSRVTIVSGHTSRHKVVDIT